MTSNFTDPVSSIQCWSKGSPAVVQEAYGLKLVPMAMQTAVWVAFVTRFILSLTIPSVTQAADSNKTKGKEEYLYSAIYTTHSLKALRHESHSFTCKLHHACLSFVNVHQMASPLTEVADIKLQLTAHLSTPKGMNGPVGLVDWPIADCLST